MSKTATMSQANASMRQNQSKQVINHEDSVRGQIKRVEDWIEESRLILRDYKKEIEMLRQEIGLMENHLSTQNDENVKVINPYVMQNFDDLQTAIRKQQTENEHALRQINELKREKSIIQQSIMAAGQKIAALEDLVGN